MKGPCTVEGCNNLTVARGLCNRHYLRWAKYGDPTAPRVIPPQSMPVDPGQRFWMYVKKTDSCWEWTGGLGDTGYGYFHKVVGQKVAAHRFAYGFLVGPIPEGMQIDHLCHVPDECNLGDDCPHRRCVNPAHLKPVTALENTQRSNAPTSIAARTNMCKRGHEFTPENTYYTPSTGGRMCRICHAEWMRAYGPGYRARRKQLQAENAN